MKKFTFTILSAELKKSHSGRYYVSLNLSYNHGGERRIIHSIALGNYLDYQKDNENKSEVIWYHAINSFLAFNIPDDAHKATQALEGIKFDAMIEVKTHLNSEPYLCIKEIH